MSPAAGVLDVAPEPDAAVRRSRGHAAKIGEAVHALEVAGRLPRHLRPVVRNDRILEWLEENGYEGDLPSPRAIGRWWADHEELLAASQDASA
ncbi:MAG TPA: hypothetical protein VH913_14105 [Hyphomicrobiaceae bacterium]|jgi:hypothetical protein